ncbi:MAG TPA: hypothetical protein VK524_18385 [Polyangiaceae bacterium]|nr:hypothetical protein [Polyangiaceae bacterium]
MSIQLSRRQAGDADRVGGIELMILWPASLGAEPADLGVDEEREASELEQRTAEALVRESCAQYGLVRVHVRVARVRRALGLEVAPGEVRTHLAVIIIGKRWVRASTQKVPRVAFAQEL